VSETEMKLMNKTILNNRREKKEKRKIIVVDF
jgi:hypothetical protein